ncbi:MAG: hypothetical protein GJ671_01965 [Alteromonadaceae bacterium]|nr:hypothetical protein [Alteromonadaceae bacterium]
MTVSSLSKITLGTMRLSDKNTSLKDCIGIFDAAIQNGVNSFHVSTEYNSFELVALAFKNLGVNADNCKLVVKLASPHFDETSFSQLNLEARIDNILDKTGLEKIQVAQWMWRQSPVDDSARIQKLLANSEEIKSCFQDISLKGKVDEFGCFPYTSDFMKSVNNLGISKVHINYQNFWENELVNGGIHNYSIALRPFFGGKVKKLHPNFIKELNVIENRSVISHSLNYVLSHPNICSAVVGINTLKQLSTIIETSDSIKKNINTFNTYQSLLENNPYLR